MAGVTSVVIDGTSYLVDDINAVDFSEGQGLSEQQQQQGRSNIGAAADTALAGKADKSDVDALESALDDLSDDVAEFTEALADKASTIVDTASGAIASFPDGAAVAAKDVTIGIEPVQAGSGDPSPTNVRPISGWTGANVTSTGKNLLKNTAISSVRKGVTFTVNSDGSIIVNGTATGTIWFDVARNVSLKAGTYTLSGTPSGLSGYGYLYDDTSFGSWIDGSGSGAVKTFTSDVTGNIVLRITQNTTINNAVFFPMIEVGGSKTSFEPYAGTTYPISWQSEAGTVYGGTLDVTTGLLTVDRVQVDLSAKGSSAWTMRSRSDNTHGVCFDCSNNPLSTGVLSEQLYSIGVSGYNPYNFLGNKAAAFTDGLIRIGFDDSLQINSVSDLVVFLSNNSAQINYPISTPQTYQLTPTEVEMLLGENNVWADTGDSTVTYHADTKLYIQKINAPTDDDMIADAQIASGKYFIVGGNLYKSTTTIPAGDAINPGSNCILTNLADALNALNT